MSSYNKCRKLYLEITFIYQFSQFLQNAVILEFLNLWFQTKSMGTTKSTKIRGPIINKDFTVVSVFQMHRLFFKVVHMVLEKSKYDLIKLNTQKLFDIGARTLENNHTTLLVSYPAFQTNLMVVLPTIQYIQLVT